jgi:hypothetical protein
MLVHVDDRELNGDAGNAGKMVKAECKTCQFMCSAQDFLLAYRKPRNPVAKGEEKRAPAIFSAWRPPPSADKAATSRQPGKPYQVFDFS